MTVVSLEMSDEPFFLRKFKNNQVTYRLSIHQYIIIKTYFGKMRECFSRSTRAIFQINVSAFCKIKDMLTFSVIMSPYPEPRAHHGAEQR